MSDGLRNSVTDLNPRSEPSLTAEATLRLFKDRGYEHVRPGDEWKPGMVIAAVISENIRKSWFSRESPGRQPSVAVFTHASGIQTDTRPGIMAINNAESVGFFAIDPKTHHFFLSSAKAFDFDETGDKKERPYGVDMDHVFLFKNLDEWQRFINRSKDTTQRQ